MIPTPATMKRVDTSFLINVLLEVASFMNPGKRTVNIVTYSKTNKDLVDPIVVTSDTGPKDRAKITKINTMVTVT